MPRYFLLIALILIGCSESEAPKSSAKSTELPVIEAETITVSEMDWPRIVRSQGSLFPDEVATLGIKVEGRVVDVHVDLGDVVSAGEPLVTVYQDDFKLMVDQAEAQLRQARSAVGLKPDDPIEKLQPVNAPPVKEQRALWDEATANLRRADELLAQNAIVRAEYDQIASAERVAAARYDSSLNSVQEKIANISVQQAMYELAKEDLENTVLKAPFNAVVQRRIVAPGTYVKVGDPLVVLVRVDKLRYRGTVPERLSQMINIGQPVELEIESISDPQSTKVTRISPLLDQMSRALMFEAVVENPDRNLRAGLFAEASVIVDENAQAVVIPIDAVVQFAGSEKVWKVVDGKVSEQIVLLGDRREGLVRILQGLQPGDVVLGNAKGGQAGILADAKAEKKAKEDKSS